MNKSNKPLVLQNYLEIPDIFIEICDFLPFKDLIILMSISHKLYETINLYFHKFLIRSQAISNEPQANSATKHHLIFAQHFCKKLLRISLRSNQMHDNSINSRSEIRYLNKKLKDFKEIHQYTCFLLQDKRFLIEENGREPNQKLKYSFEQIEQFRANNKFIVFSKSSGQFTITFFSCLQEKLLFLSEIQGQTLDFQLTNNFLLILTRNLQAKGDSLEAYFLNIEDLEQNYSADSLKPTKLLFPEGFKEVKSFSISNKIAYFVSQNNSLFEVELNLRKTLKMKKSELFNEQKIVKVFSGSNQNFAIASKENKSFENFNNEEVVKVAEKIGLDDYLKIFKYSKVTGKELMNCSDEFLKKNFGLKNQQLILALRREMQKNSKSTKENILYFWGDNSKKQFYFEKNNKKIIEKPEIIQLTNIKETIEEIVSFCDVSYLVGSSGSIWSTIPKDFQASFKEKNHKKKENWVDVWISKEKIRYFFYF